MRLITNLLIGPNDQTAEITRSVHGLSQRELERGCLEIQYFGKAILVLNPVAMFKAKASNVESLDQQGRQDVKHLLMMTIVTRCFLLELLKVETGVGRPKAVLTFLNEHLANVRQFSRLSPLQNSDWDRFFPMAALASHPSEAVRHFHERLVSMEIIPSVPKVPERVKPSQAFEKSRPENGRRL